MGMRFGRGVVVAVLAAGLLAGCSKQNAQDDEQPANMMEERAEPAEEAPPPVEEPAPAKTPDPAPTVTEALPPDEPASPSEQMLEDADATGLTARSAPREGREDKEPSSDPVGDLIGNDGAVN